MGKAAEKFGTMFGISSLGTVSIEEIGSTISTPKLFQLYVHKDKELTKSMIGVVAEDVAPAFAVPAAYGDLTASVLALLAVVALRFRWPIAIPLVWIFNVEGTLDMLYAVSQGLRHVDAGQLGGVVFIPLLIVPLLAVTHVMIFQLLLRKAPS